MKENKQAIVEYKKFLGGQIERFVGLYVFAINGKVLMTGSETSLQEAAQSFNHSQADILIAPLQKKKNPLLKLKKVNIE